MKHPLLPAGGSSLLGPLGTVLAATGLLSLASFQQRARPASPPEHATVDARADSVARLLLSWVDVDGDGREDVFVHQPGGAVQLLRNEGLGGFLDITQVFGLDTSLAVTSVASSDVDEDGYPDLVQVGVDGSLRYLHNLEGAWLQDESASAGLSLAGVHGASWGDFDSDGRPDLMVLTSDRLSVFRNVDGTRFEGLASAQAPPAAPLSPLSVGTGSPPDPREPDAVTPLATPAGERSRRPVRAVPDVSVAGLGSHRSGPAAAGHEVILELQPGPSCVPSLRDRAGGACIGASSLATLGELYPMSLELNVHPSLGRVGIGTSNPGGKLQIESSGETGLVVNSGANQAGYFRNTSSSTAALYAEAAAGGTAAFFNSALKVGYRVSAIPPILANRFVADVDASSSGRVRAMNGSNVTTFELRAEQVAGNGALLTLARNNGGTTISLDAETGSAGGPALRLYDSAGVQTFYAGGEDTTGGAIVTLDQESGSTTIRLDAEGLASGAGQIGLFSGVETVRLLADDRGGGGKIQLQKLDGTNSVTLAANVGGKGRITTDVLAITGGADLVETFQTGDAICPPGSVVVIDLEHAGRLEPSSEPYDTRLAGVVSGAGGVEPGLRLEQRGVLDGDTPVALSGRVYVNCTTENGAIRPGDLLTSSSTAGQAMRASDPERSFGAVLGKAMGSLADGETGLVLMLVNLQ